MLGGPAPEARRCAIVAPVGAVVVGRPGREHGGRTSMRGQADE